MIHVDRRRVKPPASLRDKRATEAREQAVAFFGQPSKQRRQLTFNFDPSVYAGDDVRAALHRLFEAKCAFCESPLPTVSAAEVVQLRPAQGALDLDGAFAPDHYYWLAYEWENLYASCAACAQLRGSRFPVGEPRVSAETRGPELDRERPLLLDPCRDAPEEHLLYVDDGTVVSDTERGRVTCDVLGLNREALVSARRDALTSVQAELDELAGRQEGARVPADALAPLQDSARAFAGLRRQRVAELMRSRKWEPEGEALNVRAESPSVKRSVHAEFGRIQAEQENYTLEDPSAQKGYFSHARQIERVEIRNLRVIEQLDLVLDLDAIASAEPRLGAERERRAPWLMLLGENGLGKSTVLQAVCLALLDERTREGLGLNAADFVRNGTRRASVKVHLTGTTEPIELVARAGSRHFDGGGSLKALLLGYGATRLLPTPGHPASESPTGAQELARAENLFDPFAPIGDATSWLLSLEDGRFEDVARGLRQLLMLEEHERLVRDRRRARVQAEGGGTRVPLEALSAGYQSVIALTTDVMKVMLRLWDTAAMAEGVVVVDELGAHLHPRWRMRIVEALRGVFPRVQFLASTHDPLCLRGLADGEVVVLRRDSEGRIVALDDLPPPSSMRVDQLLSSEHFGLGSTVDPELEGLFAEYYLLKAKRRRSAREESRLQALHAELDGRQVLGTTRRERLIYEATDEYLAREVDETDHERRRQLKEETKERIRAAWSGAAR